MYNVHGTEYNTCAILFNKLVVDSEKPITKADKFRGIGAQPIPLVSPLKEADADACAHFEREVAKLLTLLGLPEKSTMLGNIETISQHFEQQQEAGKGLKVSASYIAATGPGELKIMKHKNPKSTFGSHATYVFDDFKHMKNFFKLGGFLAVTIDGSRLASSLYSTELAKFDREVGTVRLRFGDAATSYAGTGHNIGIMDIGSKRTTVYRYDGKYVRIKIDARVEWDNVFVYTDIEILNNKTVQGTVTTGYDVAYCPALFPVKKPSCK
ncbi:MAG: hypothetical protein CMN60_20590 [Sphingobium sp.]|nr:hypothetical protein [Sphingobium sp.]MBS50045.1 hypothetical protein [Sphingobium sp.]|tara:strand:+ start:53592 stop:54395 length:804 start_codon:yes stop_codon:yes gene_type:complete